MGRTVDSAISAVSTTSLLKREDCKRTKHDSAFSQWKILIGPSNWEDYLLNKEGAERYRTQNIPNCSSCPGVYELGIAVSLPRTEGKGSSRLGSKSIIPVYLGQADNVRTRLQQYGRDGAHLENGWSNREHDDRKVLGLFSDIFSLGFAIAFRWAPMNNKKDAEKTESQLLKTFDYAWNRGMNGERRPGDIHQKLNSTTSSAKKVPLMLKKLHVFHPKKVGLSIKRCEPNAFSNGSSFYTEQKGTNILSRIFKFSRTRPTFVSQEPDTTTNTCGVALGHGSICTRPPVDGRKRCPDHKGLKVNAFIKPCSPTNTENTLHLTCGATLDDGFLCTRVPVFGRKRCEEHKGMRINRRVNIPLVTQEKHLGMGVLCKRQVGCEEHDGVDTTVDGCGSKVVGRVSGADSLTCVAVTLKGSSCRRKAGKESKFCWQHEAMRSKVNL